MEYGSRPETEGFRRLEVAQALIDRGEDPADAARAAGLAQLLYGDEIRRVIDAAVRLHDAPVSLIGELVDVYTLRFALEALAWTPLAPAPDGDWHIEAPDRDWVARIRAASPAGAVWEFDIDTSDQYEQMVSARVVTGADR